MKNKKTDSVKSRFQGGTICDTIGLSYYYCRSRCCHFCCSVFSQQEKYGQNDSGTRIYRTKQNHHADFCH